MRLFFPFSSKDLKSKSCRNFYLFCLRPSKSSLWSEYVVFVTSHRLADEKSLVPAHSYFIRVTWLTCDRGQVECVQLGFCLTSSSSSPFCFFLSEWITKVCVYKDSSSSVNEGVPQGSPAQNNPPPLRLDLSGDTRKTEHTPGSAVEPTGEVNRDLCFVIWRQDEFSWTEQLRWAWKDFHWGLNAIRIVWLGVVLLPLALVGARLSSSAFGPHYD